MMEWLLGALAILGGAVALLWRLWMGERGRRIEAEQKGKANERINQADIGVGATDDERRKRLQQFSDGG